MQMKIRQSLTLADEPTGPTYQKLLEFCAMRSSHLTLVIRESISTTLEFDDFLQEVKAFTVSSSLQSEWPGTILLSGTARVVVVSVCGPVMAVVSQQTDQLFGWRQPQLPEDLSFLRSDGSPLFVMISHENDAYFELDETEAEDLRSNLSNLCLVAE